MWQWIQDPVTRAGLDHLLFRHSPHYSLSTEGTKGQCKQNRDHPQLVLSIIILLGITASYFPQHLRIIRKRSSDGISPWFIFLGCISTSSSFFNLLILQWRVVRCCQQISAGSCLEQTLGIAQLGVQCLMTHCMLLLYMIYFPSYKKVNEIIHQLRLLCLPSRSFAWTISLLFSKVIIGHFLVCLVITVLSASLAKDREEGARHGWIFVWAGFLGVLGVLLATIQYLPQIIETYFRKSVGALSIPTMIMQTSAAVLLAISLGLRPDVNWSAWVVYAATALFQSILLGMCIFYYYRAKKAGISSFGDLSEATPLLPTEPRVPSFTANTMTIATPASTNQSRDATVPMSRPPQSCKKTRVV